MTFGLGEIAQAHKADEYIRIDEYLDCIAHLIRFIHRLAAQQSPAGAGQQGTGQASMRRL